MNDTQYLCPGCSQYPPIPDPFNPIWPFCSELCHTTWASKHYEGVENSEGEKHYTTEYMQRRLKEMGKEVRREV